MTEKREFDLVIFGATGYTGFFMVRELLQVIAENPTEYSSLKWAVAGRNLTKLNETLAKLAQELNVNLSKVDKIKADVGDADSLLKMAEKTLLIVNVVGPFQLYGKQVVDACVRSGTHHIDISGESTYIESSQIEYDAKAQESGSLIISTCGWDSIPNDVGVDFLKKHFEGKLHSVESFMRFHFGPKGYSGNFGTFQSAYTFISDYFSYRRTHSQLYKEVLTEKLPQSRMSLPMKVIPFRQTGWNVPFMGADKAVVDRSQHYNFTHFNEPPVQFQPYINFSKFLHMMAIVSFSGVLVPFSLLRPGRYLLEKYPHIFTFGHFTKKGPTREQVETTRFSLTLHGKGWSKSLVGDDPHKEPEKPFDKEMTVLVSGRDPGYLATSTCTIQAGLTIIKERELMPKGGVLTPASAFRNTKLVERLQSRGLTFEIVNK